ncbi:hypothetical protein [Longitalea luteola]|uniref:hypothetical protein n=1 Tax=Longitalea luteola TaxID=2812563 RepID=UPI001A96E210|nr:hypothetical protein [Longitalea luteola]
MKVEEHRSLWSAIQQFPLDEPNAAITFSHKLAAKQNWTAFYTERVINEYRKFLFLCCISPNGASPSQAVDEAWHLHLTYTRSYWIDLCKNTLGKDIHHHPSRGGDEEDHKHRDWYKETLQLYQSVFESPPPDDIWPPPQEPQIHLPEPNWVIRNEIIALVVMLLTLPLIISASLHHVLSPFSLNGPQFLVFFPLFAVSCIIGYVLLQNEKGRILRQLVTEHFPVDVTPFQIAQFLFGKHRAIQAGIVDLLRRNLIGLSADNRFIVHKNWYNKPANEQNPLIQGFLKEQEDSIHYERIATEWYDEEAIKHPALQKLYLLAYHKEHLVKKYHLMLLPFVIIMIRFFQGAVNHKALGNLFFELWVLLIISVILTNFMSRRRMVLEQVKKLAGSLQQDGTLYSDQVVSLYSIHGNDSLTWFAEGAALTAIFAPYPVLNHDKQSTTNSSCSSCSSCTGSGGGDGGGGCGSGCGGGCGGCGS